MLIARLIADPAMLETRLDAVRRALDVAAMPVTRAATLDSCEEVLEFVMSHGDTQTAAAILVDHFGVCDMILADQEIEVPHLFVSDMDSTMIGQECIDELADFAGLKERVADITERAMRGELDFADALRERVALLEGLGEEAVERCLTERICPVPGARTLVQTLKTHDCRAVLVTGGFHHFADRVADDLGFDRVVGNRLEVADGRLTGKLAGQISDASTKLATLEEERAALGDGVRVLATGDGANDIPMIEAADYGMAYRAKPKARNAANGIIVSEDLTVILSLLGIPRKKWVQG